MVKIQKQVRTPRSSSGRSKVPLTYYRSAKPQDSSPSPFKNREPARGRKLRKFLARTIDAVVIMIIIAGFIYSLMVKAEPQILISSEAYHPTSLYRAAVASELGAVKNRNKITLDERGIVKSMQSQFPEIAGVVVTLPIFNQSPTVKISVATPSFVLNSGNVSYVIDSQGRVVAQKSDLPDIKDLPVVNDQTGFEVEKGKRVLSESAVNFIKDVIAQSERANIPVKSLTLPPLAQELNLYVKDKPYYVRFYLGGDSLQQIGQFIATREQLEESKIHPKQYLDARILGKVFYK